MTGRLGAIWRAIWRAVPADIRLLAFFLLALLPLRIAATASVRWMSIDGGYYTEVARHVRDGLGLTTNVSLYHMGYEYFPHPTSVYPLWPLLLGYAARVGDLYQLAHWLPLFFYFTAIIAAFGFGRRLSPVQLLPVHVPGLHAGHVFASMLAFQREFIVFTSIPYTEGLAWTLLFGLLWRLAAQGGGLQWGWALEMGLWLGLVYLARAQLVVVAMGMALAYGVRLLVGPSRVRVALHGGLALCVFAVFLVGWWAYIRGFVADAKLASLLRFDQNQANTLLSPIDIIVSSESPLHFVLDRLNGFLVAWSLGGSTAYYRAFYAGPWALPLALLLAGYAAVRALRSEGGGAVRRWAAGLREPEAFAWIGLATIGLGALLSVHLVHKHYNGTWYFAKRQGLTSLPAFILPMWWLLRAPIPAVRTLSMGLGVLLYASYCVSGLHEAWDEAEDTKSDTRGEDEYGGLVEWLHAQSVPTAGTLAGPAAEAVSLVVVMDSAVVQRVSYRTRSVGYHWFDEHTPWMDVLTMTDRLGARYVITRASERDWAFHQGAGDRLHVDFRRVRNAPPGFTIHERVTPEEGA
ncbi:MAG: hypothetical protein EXR69_07565 [Myxococcales bacterium]|nr:hypothetical protein [Myxococcales bacterium]